MSSRKKAEGVELPLRRSRLWGELITTDGLQDRYRDGAKLPSVAAADVAGAVATNPSWGGTDCAATRAARTATGCPERLRNVHPCGFPSFR